MLHSATVRRLPATDTTGTRFRVTLSDGRECIVRYEHSAEDARHAAVEIALEELGERCSVSTQAMHSPGFVRYDLYPIVSDGALAALVE